MDETRSTQLGYDKLVQYFSQQIPRNLYRLAVLSEDIFKRILEELLELNRVRTEF